MLPAFFLVWYYDVMIEDQGTHSTDKDRSEEAEDRAPNSYQIEQRHANSERTQLQLTRKMAFFRSIVSFQIPVQRLETSVNISPLPFYA